jgi:hypothetical protein
VLGRYEKEGVVHVSEVAGKTETEPHAWYCPEGVTWHLLGKETHGRMWVDTHPEPSPDAVVLS